MPSGQRNCPAWPSQNRPGQAVKVLLGDENSRALIINIENIQQVAKLVSGSEFRDRVTGKINASAFGERETKVRLQGSLNMKMQLNFLHG